MNKVLNNRIYNLHSDIDKDCLICLEYINIEDSYSTNCGHIFHKNCITRAMELADVCPKCKYKDIGKDVELEFTNPQYIHFLNNFDVLLPIMKKNRDRTTFYKNFYDDILFPLERAELFKYAAYYGRGDIIKFMLIDGKIIQDKELKLLCLLSLTNGDNIETFKYLFTECLDIHIADWRRIQDAFKIHEAVVDKNNIKIINTMLQLYLQHEYKKLNHFAGFVVKNINQIIKIGDSKTFELLQKIIPLIEQNFIIDYIPFLHILSSGHFDLAIDLINRLYQVQHYDYDFTMDLQKVVRSGSLNCVKLFCSTFDTFLCIRSIKIAYYFLYIDILIYLIKNVVCDEDNFGTYKYAFDILWGYERTEQIDDIMQYMLQNRNIFSYMTAAELINIRRLSKFYHLVIEDKEFETNKYHVFNNPIRYSHNSFIEALIKAKVNFDYDIVTDSEKILENMLIIKPCCLYHGTQGNYGNYILYFAIKHGILSVVKTLALHRVDLNGNCHGALRFAVALNKVNIAKFLIKQGDVNVHDGELLRLMSLNNRCDIPNLILSHYPIINDDAFESAIKNDAPYALGKLIISHPNIKNVDFSKMLSLNPSKKIINVLENYNIISFN